jgi:predicted transcriptional regulator
MSIHPMFAERILRGEKLVEFRRRPVGGHVTHIVIYATAPVRAVVGVAEINGVRQASPAVLWKAFGRVGGIERAKFFEYFEGVVEGFAYVLGGARFCAPLRLGSDGLPPRAPQAFQYLEARTLEAVLRRSYAADAGVAAAG